MINLPFISSTAGKENLVSASPELKESQQEKGLFGLLFQSINKENNETVNPDFAGGLSNSDEEPAGSEDIEKIPGASNDTVSGTNDVEGREVEIKENLLIKGTAGKTDLPEVTSHDKLNDAEDADNKLSNNAGQIEDNQDENKPENQKKFQHNFIINDLKNAIETITVDDLGKNASTPETISAEGSNNGGMFSSSEKQETAVVGNVLKLPVANEALPVENNSDDSEKLTGKTREVKADLPGAAQKENALFDSENLSKETAGNNSGTQKTNQTQIGFGKQDNLIDSDKIPVSAEMRSSGADQKEEVPLHSEKESPAVLGDLSKTPAAGESQSGNSKLNHSEKSENKSINLPDSTYKADVLPGSEKQVFTSDENVFMKPDAGIVGNGIKESHDIENNQSDKQPTQKTKVPDKPIFTIQDSPLNSDRFSAETPGDDNNDIPENRISHASRFKPLNNGFQPQPDSGGFMSDAEKEPAALQKEQLNDLLMAARFRSPAEDGNGNRRLNTNQVRENRNRKYRSSFANRNEMYSFKSGINTESNKPFVLSGLNSEKQGGLSFPGMAEQSSTPTATDQPDYDTEIFWKDHSAEFSDSREKASVDSQSGFMRLGQIPLSNIALRRNFVPGLTQSILQATGGGKSAPQTWQKHNFVLEDGKNIQLSAREIDGVLQLKLSSTHSELSKLLLQHQHELREHLEKELDLKIDLQFTNDENGGMQEFFGDSSFSKNSQGRNSARHQEKITSKTAEQILPKSVRKFGYNQMEWTA